MLTAALLLTGCGNIRDTGSTVEDNGRSERESETVFSDLLSVSGSSGSIMAYRTDWQAAERRLTDYPQDASYLGSTEQGYFYYIRDTKDNLKKNFYFQTWEGERTNLSEDDSPAFGTFLHRGKRILSLMKEEGMTVAGLDAAGGVTEYAAESGFVFPMIDGYEDKIVFLTYDTEPGSDDIFYTITEADLTDGTAELMLRTKNRVASVSESGRYITYVEEDSYGRQKLCQFDREKKETVRSAPLPGPVVFAVAEGDTVYLSERGSLGESLGGIYSWKGDTLENTGFLPFIADNNIIRDGKKIDGAHLWRAQENVLAFDERSNQIWVMDFKEIGNMAGVCMEDDGVSAVAERDGEFCYVKYTPET